MFINTEISHVVLIKNATLLINCWTPQRQHSVIKDKNFYIIKKECLHK